VFNEKPMLEEAAPANGAAAGVEADVLPRGAVIHTTKGDITLKLFPDDCPKTVENFTTHARNGYYDGILFHRVIKGFMVQTGDPLGAAATRSLMSLDCRCSDAPLALCRVPVALASCRDRSLGPWLLVDALLGG
jgi:hypothetical protein